MGLETDRVFVGDACQITEGIVRRVTIVLGGDVSSYVYRKDVRALSRGLAIGYKATVVIF